MSVTTPTLYDAAKVARRAVVARWSTRNRVPRLRFSSAGTPASPMVWMICPDWDRPAGGIRMQYRAVDALNEAGIRAAVVHKKLGFSCSWFAHDTWVVAAPDVVVGERDVIVVPELYGPSIVDLPSGVRQVILNQNAYLTLDSLMEGPEAAAPYVENPDLSAVVVVSEHSAEMLAHAFPGAPIRRIHLGLDPVIHHPPARTAPTRIAYMPRRRAAEASQVLRLLEHRGALEGWEVVPIDGCTETEVAEVLRTCRIFLSFSHREGFGLPPCEALACGCLVVGFDGFAGREFFRAPFAESVEDGDVVAFARAAERLIRRVDADPEGMAAIGLEGARYIRESYARETERRELVEIFGPLMEE